MTLGKSLSLSGPLLIQVKSPVNYCTNSPILELGFLAKTSRKEKEDKFEMRKPKFKCTALPNEARATSRDEALQNRLVAALPERATAKVASRIQEADTSLP